MDKRLLARSSPAGLAWWHSGPRWGDNQSAWYPAKHLLILSQKIVEAATGKLPRLIVTMPPRHGKSELISRFTPAWFLGRFPDRKVILVGYNDIFAAQWGRKSREVLEAEESLFGVALNKITTGGGHWELAGRHQGVMTTAGIGGGITGKGAHLMIIDDPVKNAEEAKSETTQASHWDWWQSTARTRLQKDAAVILVMTRWHENDLAGQLIANDPSRDEKGRKLPPGERRADVEGDEWEILNLPAFAEPPSGQDVDEIGRQQGEVLCPELGFDDEWMQQTKRALGAYWFSALYQQRPAPAEGLMFKVKNFRYYNKTGLTADGSHLITIYRDGGDVEVVDSAYCTKFMTVDVAASEKQTSDFTVCSTWLITPKRDLLLWNMRRDRFAAHDVKPFLKRAYFEDMPAFVAIERNFYGLTVIQELLIEGLPVVRLEADTDKVSRALSAIARYEEHRVFHPQHAHWLDDLESELKNFPNDAHDDMVDTVSYAAIQLPMMGAGGKPRSGAGAPLPRSGRRSVPAIARERDTITGGILREQF